MSERWIDPGLETMLERIVREQTIDECEAIARKQQDHSSAFSPQFNGGWMAAGRNIADAISALRASLPPSSDEGLPTADDVRGILGPPPPSQDETIKALLWALEMARPFVALTLTQEQAEASPRWYSKASNALIAMDAALKGAAK